MPSPPVNKELVERFKFNIEDYKKGNYNETQVRREFIDPFFKALGWDVANEKGYAEAYKDVVHEFSLKTKDKAEAPDYLFRIGGTKKFFVEAKKPSVNLKDDISPAFQLRRYAWSAKLPLSILTDFEELAVYDCRIQPKKTDKSSTARINYFTYEEYIDRWDEIESIFSREAILKGSFDKFAESNKGKRGTAEVDDAFLKEIEKWRELLARNIALRNESLSNRELNFAVQKTIDRIIFLRICEDRGIEDYGQLMNLQNGANVYQRLLQIFTRADEKYNSGLFHFDDEKDRKEEPDKITPALTIDDDKLKEIIKNLYYPDSPYEFSVLPSDILGHVYEQFLGKVIRLTPGHRAVIEEKPEVKKAGGVYYTPTYIVDYIVKNTLGKKLEEIEEKFSLTNRHPDPTKAGKESHHKPSVDFNEINKAIKAASKIKVLDPACGSGSFLIDAYQYLLNWHLKLYSVEISFMKSPAAQNLRTDTSLTRQPEGQVKSLQKIVYQTKENEYRLTTAEKKRILLNNIYGVDIDSQAVEVTKLSLLLKVLEGETEESLTTQLSMFRERALPDLSSNIKCGNSLIGPDFYEQTELDLDEEEHYRINVFDWNEEIKEIMNDGGFDCVIGNPPYVRIQAMKQWAEQEINFYKKKYNSAQKGNYDLYVVFVERGYSLLCKNGFLGFILPNKMFNSQYGVSIRRLLYRNKAVDKIVNFGFNQVFKGATTYTALLFLNKEDKENFVYHNVKDLTDWILENKSECGELKSELLESDVWNFNVGKGQTIFEKLNSIESKLEKYLDVFVGLQTSADDVYIVDLIEEKENSLLVSSKSLEKEVEVEKELFHPLVSGTDIKRYQELVKRQFVLFPYMVKNEKGNLISIDYLEQYYPQTLNYLIENKQRLQNRERGKFKDQKWYRFGRNQNIGIQKRIKICVPRLVEKLHCSFDEYGEFYLDNVDVGGLSFKPEFINFSYYPLIAILNSKLMQWYFPSISAPFRGGWYSANKQFLSQLPIVYPSDELVVIFEQKVKQIINLKSSVKNVKTPQEKKNLERQIAALDKQIDQLVYELYGLTEDEIKIVEESMK